MCRDCLDTVRTELTKTLQELGVGVNKIILFGSRARYEDTGSSDYDFLIITEITYDHSQKLSIAKSIRTKLSKYAIDIIIKSEEEKEMNQKHPGSVVREALREGVEIWPRK